MHRHPILGGPEPPKPRATPSAVIQALAGLAQVAVAVVALMQPNRPGAWWIFGLVGVALLAAAFGGPLLASLGAWWRRRHDERTARRAMPELRSLVRAFQKLVEPNSTATLQAGLQEAFRNHANVLPLLHVPSVHLFAEMLSNLAVRLDEEPADAEHLLRALAELYTIVSAHSEQCIRPVFRDMPKDARDLLTQAARATLNSCRERYLEFHSAFARFTEDLSASLRASKLHAPHYVFRPDALTA